jgi:hypothetical protein
MPDPTTGWFEVAEIRNKTTNGSAKNLDQAHGSADIHDQRGALVTMGMNFLVKNFKNFYSHTELNQWQQLSKLIKLIS